MLHVGVGPAGVLLVVALLVVAIVEMFDKEAFRFAEHRLGNDAVGVMIHVVKACRGARAIGAGLSAGIATPASVSTNKNTSGERLLKAMSMYGVGWLPVQERFQGAMDEWQTLLRLAKKRYVLVIDKDYMMFSAYDGK